MYHIKCDNVSWHVKACYKYLIGATRLYIISKTLLFFFGTAHPGNLTLTTTRILFFSIHGELLTSSTCHFNHLISLSFDVKDGVANDSNTPKLLFQVIKDYHKDVFIDRFLYLKMHVLMVTSHPGLFLRAYL